MSDLPSVKPSLAYAKIVATPTSAAWSQVYNAGSLFACLSLINQTPEENISLNSLGKDTFNKLETEFFILEEKNLSTISEALTNSFSAFPQGIQSSLALAYFLDGILYVFLQGPGKIIMKRRDTIGVLLEEKNISDTILSASGFLEHADCVILQTKQFADDISEDRMNSALELTLPNDIAETLSLDVHEKDDGGQAAIIVVYQGTNKIIEPDEELGSVVAKEQEEATFKEERDSYDSPTVTSKKQLKLLSIKLPSTFFSKLSRSKKIFLSLTIILAILLIFSIIYTKTRQDQTRFHGKFQSVYEQSQVLVKEAQSMKNLNPQKSQNDYKQAETLLTNTLPSFPQTSTEHKQLADLLSQIDNELSTIHGGQIAAQQASVDATDMLGFEKATSGTAFTQDGQNIYYFTSQKINAVSKTDGKNKTIVTNNNDWLNPQDIAVYQGNIYVLDTKNAIVKFVASGNNFSNVPYFSSSPDFSQAIALSIDSSIYILFNDKTIQKYTKGQKDSFTISQLTQPFLHPIKLFTNADTQAIYVLDPESSRIVKLSKDGTFLSQYNVSQLKNAKDFEVDEKNKKILFLSKDSVWQISIQ